MRKLTNMRENELLWNKIFQPDLYEFMSEVSDESEDEASINKFREHCNKKIDCKAMVILATKWSEYDMFQQVQFAIHYAGEEEASRLMMLLDFMYMKYRKGLLK